MSPAPQTLIGTLASLAVLRQGRCVHQHALGPQAQRCLTLRSTGPATASTVSLVRGTWCIIAYQAYGACLRGPVSSNVRPHVTIIGPSLQRQDECAAVLRSLPRWFGIEDSLLMYVRDSATLPTFAIEQDTRLLGFLSLQEHFPASWEVHCIAIAAEARNKGFGTRLLNHAESWLAARGVRFLQIKTVADSSPSPEYAESRKFYAARGYLPLEVFPTLWHPRNPALQLVKALNAA